MNDFIPFIHEKKKKEWEPEPMYIDLTIPLLEEIEKDEEQSNNIIIIQL